ncbi:PREDICTED: putative uncharacterized protein MYH16 [Trachymyrmex septentrionalis]|nr:PREDICTED: putative uncharacterized protein MYH16 [Trachymyrmex septentrionalis]XP_018341043.1 PREDICTED: putative uncharacterized protein MYH16 [Trachymyrmex septentrionalis]XP_018341044.1 PREDICTED: putative uncharacterized protein MYH16 [Trachymyrmex septentrionalis]
MRRNQSTKAPAAVSQRITRLKSREISAKPAAERKLKPERKAVIINKNLKKVNVSAKNKTLHLSKESISLRNSRTPVRRLRPRQIRKNYCEDSRLLQQFISPKQQDSIVIIEKLKENVESKKVPVYKAVEPFEKSSEDKKDVYDFKFDSNDTKEKASKKKLRKRNVNKEKGKTTKRTTRKKVIAKTRSHKIIESPKIDADPSVKIIQNDSPLEFVVATTSTKGKNVKKIEINKDIRTLKELINKNIEKEIEPPRIDADNQTIEVLDNTRDHIEAPRVDINIHEATTFSGTFTEQVRKENTSKPRIISIEDANNIIVTTSSPKKTDVQPFRPKNIFDNKTLSKGHNSTLRSTILMKTLSPIVKTTSTFDFGSPWRPPILTFSKTKHFIQSTPYKDFETKKGNKEIKKKSMETSKEIIKSNKENMESSKENMKSNKENMVPNKENMESNKENMESNKENMESNKENMESNKENMEIDKENIDTNKKNIDRRDKKRKKKSVSPRKKHVIQKKLPISENQTPRLQKKLRAAVVQKSVVQPAPARISLGEIKNVLLRPNNNVVNGDNKQTVEPMHTEVNKSLIEQKKQLVDVLDFSDTFDMLSESEKISNAENDIPLFMDLEPSHFSKPPQHSYRRKRAVKFDCSEDNNEEENENVELQPKKKKPTKLEKEHQKKINEWIKTVNSTFQEIEEYDLLIE